MNIVPIVVAAIKPQVARLEPDQRQAIIWQINRLTTALLEGDRGEAVVLLEGIGADPGMVDLVLEYFLGESVSAD